MSSDRTVRLTVDIQTKMGEMSTSVEQIKKKLGELEVPKNLRQGFNATFDELAGRIEKVKELTQNNEMKLVDEKKVTSEIEAIEKDWANFIKRIESEGDKIHLGNTKEMKAMVSALEEYDNKIKESTQHIKEQEAEIKKLQQAEANATRKANTARTADRNAKAALKAQAEKVSGLEQGRADAIARSKANGRSDNQAEADFNRSNLGKEYAKEINELAEAKTKAASAVQQLATAEKNEQKAQTQGQAGIQNAQAKLKEYEQTLQTVSSGALEELKNKLTEMQQKGEIQLNFDPQTITSAEELKEKLKEVSQTNLEQSAAEINKIGEAANIAKTSMEGVGESIKKTSDSTRNLGNEVDQFKNRVTYFFQLNNAVMLLRRALRQAVETAKDLDKLMTQTAVVTDFSVGDMWKRLPEYTKNANALGVSIHDVYEASTLYYQQGLKTNEVMALTNETLKMGRIAGLEAADATDRMTNALRGFNMEINETNAQRINDVYSNLAAHSASNVDEISTAMTKVASLAKSANMTFENTSAILSQIIETTREAPETAGTALKTIIARFSEVKKLYSEGQLAGTDEEGEAIEVNKVATALKSAGISMNEYFTGAKGLDQIFMELASKWDSLEESQQRYIATMAAGSRQQSRFIAMMQDYNRTLELTSLANDSAGASQKQFEKTLESLETKLNQLKNAWNTFLMGIANNEAIKIFITAITDLLNTINNMIDMLSAGSSGIKTFLSLFAAGGIFIAFKIMLNSLFNSIVPQVMTIFDQARAEVSNEQKNMAAGQRMAEGIGRGLKVGMSKFTKNMTNMVGRGAAQQETENRGLFGLKGVRNANQEVKAARQEVEANRANLNQTRNNMIPQRGSFVRKTYDQLGAKSQAYIDQKSDVVVANNKLIQSEEKLKAAEEKQGTAAQGATAQLKGMAQGAALTGAAILVFTSILQELGVENEQLYKVLRIVALALMALPLILQIVEVAIHAFAKSATAAISSIPIVGWIAAAITALLTLAAIFYTVFRQETNEEKLKRLEEAANTAADAANSAREAYDNLAESHDKYTELTNKLQNLVKGTKEYTATLIEANNQVLKLKEIMPDLKLTIDFTTGALTVSESEWQRALEQQLKKAQIAQAAQISAGLTADRFKIKNTIQGMQSDEKSAINKASWWTGGLLGGSQLLFAGASPFPVDPITSFAAAPLLNWIGNSQRQETIEKGFNILLDKYSGNIEGFQRDFATNLEGMAEATGLTTEQLKKNYQSIQSTLQSQANFDAQFTSGYSALLSGMASEEMKAVEGANEALSNFTAGLQDADDYFDKVDEYYKELDGKNTHRDTLFRDIITGAGFDIADFTDLDEIDAKRKGYQLITHVDASQMSEKQLDQWYAQFYAAQQSKTQQEDLFKKIEESGATRTQKDQLYEMMRGEFDLSQVGEGGLWDALTKILDRKTLFELGYTKNKVDEFETKARAEQKQKYNFESKTMAETVATAANTAGEMAKAAGIDSTTVAHFAKTLESKFEGDEDIISSLTQTIAQRNAIADKGFKDIISSYSKWSQLVNRSTGEIKISSAADQAIFDEMNTSLKQMLNYAGNFSEDFYKNVDVAKNLEKAINGDVDAYQELQKLAAEDYMNQLKIENRGIDLTAAKQATNDLQSYIQNLDLPDLEVGVTYDNKELLNLFNKYFEANKITVAEAANILATYGFSSGGLQQTSKGVRVSSLQSNGQGVSLSAETLEQLKKNSYTKEFDELKNFTEAISEEARKRNRLENQYKLLLDQENTNLNDILKNRQANTASLKTELEYQKQLASQEKSMLDNALNHTYEISEGTRATFASAGTVGGKSLWDLYHYDEATGRIVQSEDINTIDKTSEFGKALEAWISYIDQHAQGYEEATDAVLEKQVELTDQIQDAIDGYRSFEDRVKDAIVALAQKEIDTMKEISDATTDSMKQILEDVKKQLTNERQARSNQKTETDLQDKQNRLAYLQQDTSGANAVEIKQLQKEITDAQESYTDTLIDQMLQQMQDDADEAKEQRERQIKIMEEDLELSQKTGAIWDQVHALMNNAIDEDGNIKASSELVSLLEKAEDWSSLSDLGKEQWWTQYKDSIIKAQESLPIAEEKFQTDFNGDGSVTKISEMVDAGADKIVAAYSSKPTGNGGSGNGGNVGYDFSSVKVKDQHTDTELQRLEQQAMLGNDEAKARAQYILGQYYAKQDKQSSNKTYKKERGSYAIIDGKAEDGVYEETFDNSFEDQAALKQTKGWIQYQDTSGKGTIYDAKGYTGDNPQELFAPGEEVYINDKFTDRVGNNWYEISKGGMYYLVKGKVLTTYKTGGLADFTGPAWLDGTPSRPELVLNQADTQNFIQLKNILSSILSDSTSPTGSLGGDTYIDVNIDATIDSDYSVDELANRVKTVIVEDANYRNSNVLYGLR